MPSRQRSLKELSVQSLAGGTNPDVRTNLEVDSSSEVDTKISNIPAPDLSLYTLETRTDTLEGEIDSNTTGVSDNAADIIINDGLISDNTDAIVANGVLISDNEADIVNLDLSLTAAIATQFNNDSATATAGGATLPATPEGFVVININGVDKKIPYYNL